MQVRLSAGNPSGPGTPPSPGCLLCGKFNADMLACILILQLSLPEGVSVDVIVSSVVDANHVFVQQPTHPTFSSLERLSYCMNLCYSHQDSIVPQLPRPIDRKLRNRRCNTRCLCKHGFLS